MRWYKITAVGVFLGGITFGVVRLLTKSAAASERFILPLIGLYLAIGLLLLWKTVYQVRPNEYREQSMEITQNQQRKDSLKREPISRYGYSFILAVALILVLDLLIR